MFHVPKSAGGHPRLMMAILAGFAVAIVALFAHQLIDRGKAEEPVAVEPLPPRPPVVVVEDLPGLAARMPAPSGGRDFMGAVLVARGDEVLYRKAWGRADETGRALDLDDRFRLASLSKQFTAAAILKLQDEGRLTVDDPLCDFIDDCPEAWAPIRLTHLLSHTSVVPELMARPGWGRVRVTPTALAELTAESAKYPLQFEPGTRIRYDNAGYNLLAAVVERASGQAFPDYLRTALFEPLGMNDTGFDDGGDHGIVTGYANLAGGLTPQTQPNPSVVYGAGALYSTLDDMLVWTRALHGGRVLSDNSHAQMIADHAPADTPPERGHPRRDWGYGLFVNTLGQRMDPPFLERQIYHTGSWSGFRNLVTYQPDQEVTVVVLSNNYHQASEVFLITQLAMAEALGHPVPSGLRR